ETELVFLGDKKIEFCSGCGKCPPCPKDDDVQGVLEKMKSADGIIVGSPTYYGSMSGQLKTFFDRTHPLRRGGFLLKGKVGGVIAVGGSRNGGQEKVIEGIHSWMFIHDMVVVTDTETAHFGGIVQGRNLGDAEKDEWGMKTVRNLGRRVAEVAMQLKKT
ncbi:MAG: flavodoxin family protein, partial [Candidatus Aenigmarchaeota archaeon]|nr:flavodoxin family protein [Candidatus Aenigmarchaeota archaeon]